MIKKWAKVFLKTISSYLSIVIPKKIERTTQELWECCREIRIQSGGMVKGKIYSGYNTLTEEQEFWKVIKISDKQNHHILERQINPQHTEQLKKD